MHGDRRRPTRVRPGLLALAVLAAVLAVSASAEAAGKPAPTEGVVAWGPSSLIAFGAGSFHGSPSGVYVVGADGTGLRRVANIGGALALDFSPDGQTLLFSVGGSMYEVGIDGHGLHKVGPGYDGSWSPDGARIAVTRNDGIYILAANGTGVRKLVTSRYPASAPTWSPDGKKLAYVACSAPYLSRPCEHQTGFDAFVIGLNGTDKHRVTPKSGYPQCPTWSSVGKLAFLTQDATVAIVQAGGGLRTFRPGSGCPAWAPGGRRFAVPSSAGVGLLNSDGSGRRSLPVHPGTTGVIAVAWSKDGGSLAIVATGKNGRQPNGLYVVGAGGSGLKKLL